MTAREEFPDCRLSRIWTELSRQSGSLPGNNQIKPMASPPVMEFTVTGKEQDPPVAVKRPA
jgi:hypothetical protein